MLHSTRNMKPRILTVQESPIDWNSRVSMIGKTTPPAEDPELTIPKTVARFLLNHDVVEVKEAANMAPEPRELSID